MLWDHEVKEARKNRRLLTLRGDNGYREDAHFILKPNGSLYIWIDGGEGGDTECGFYGIEADRTFAPEEVEQLRKFLKAK
jgi:hypothetical protein